MDGSKEKNRDFNWAVNLNRTTLDLLGLWPETAKTFRHKLLKNVKVLIIFLGITYILLIPSLRSVKKSHEDEDTMLMISSLQFAFGIASCSIKIVIFWWKKQAIAPVVNMIEEDWMTEKCAHEKNMMVGEAQISRIIIMCVYCIMGIVCILITILPALGVSMGSKATNITELGRNLPLDIYIISDMRISPQYELTFAGQSIFIALAAMSYTGIDNFLGILVFHICGQLDILKDHLARLGEYVHFQYMLRSCLLKHIRLLRAIDIIEDTYNIIFLILFVCFGILFALYSFRIIIFFDEGKEVSLTSYMLLVFSIISLLTHMCLYCTFGNILHIQYNGIHYAAYSNEWCTVDPKIAKDLLLLLIVGTKPIFLTAGKVFPMTMVTFCNLIKTSVGYVSVLHAIRN